MVIFLALLTVAVPVSMLWYANKKQMELRKSIEEDVS